MFGATGFAGHNIIQKNTKWDWNRVFLYVDRGRSGGGGGGGPGGLPFFEKIDTKFPRVGFEEIATGSLPLKIPVVEFQIREVPSLLLVLKNISCVSIIHGKIFSAFRPRGSVISSCNKQQISLFD